MLEETELVATHTDKIKSKQALEAYWFLVGAGAASKRLKCKASGRPKGKLNFQFRLDGEWVLSLIVNRSDLLFYLRKPASEFFDFNSVRSSFENDFEVNLNPSGELTIRIETLDQARIIAQNILLELW